jgi:hypothetical protein
MVTPPPGGPPAAIPAKSGERARKLIEELEREIDDLVRERNGLPYETKVSEPTPPDTVQGLKDLARAESFSKWVGLVY